MSNKYIINILYILNFQTAYLNPERGIKMVSRRSQISRSICESAAKKTTANRIHDHSYIYLKIPHQPSIYNYLRIFAQWQL
jgi:hypothetical protein